MISRIKQQIREKENESKFKNAGVRTTNYAAFPISAKTLETIQNQRDRYGVKNSTAGSVVSLANAALRNGFEPNAHHMMLEKMGLNQGYNPKEESENADRKVEKSVWKNPFRKDDKKEQREKRSKTYYRRFPNKDPERQKSKNLSDDARRRLVDEKVMQVNQQKSNMTVDRIGFIIQTTLETDKYKWNPKTKAGERSLTNFRGFLDDVCDKIADDTITSESKVFDV